jgi:hypothetical protein
VWRGAAPPVGSTATQSRPSITSFPFELTQKRLSRSGVADAPNVDDVGVFVRLGEFVLHLKAKPHFGAASEGFSADVKHNLSPRR